MLLPFLTIKIDNLYFLWLWRKAAQIYVNAIWIRARNIKRFDAAGFAKFMLRNTSIKCVSGYCIFLR